MRARIAAGCSAAALLLTACTESGISPRVFDWTDAPAEGTPPAVEPVAPTDVLGEESEAARPPTAEAAEGEPMPTPVSGHAEVVGLDAHGLSDVSQVDVDLTVSGVRGKGRVEVEFVSPSGHPYERRTSVVEAKPDVTRTVRFSLPVAGTTVATSGMSGTWQVRFFLDGAPLTTAAFTLEP
ncbi:hypothetical protein HUA74_18120 [Myxococcus sp. CA051A]|nr:MULTISPECIES: hypothetical protein [Myxococcus]NTX06732.1 hypothetical protein [Myxococcus sp. CA040A]NTX13956.1 hypothetical protein [Myxococcus sp. CA056]NTX36787.1 hypothetical protein [Myxococcus sp. CA033]NTX58250.1 hypothetical protein [Myxococcus sp. CA039A]NTX62574.1 hypothetical protein [Myxococcus sp. CA051A]